MRVCDVPRFAFVESFGVDGHASGFAAFQPATMYLQAFLDFETLHEQNMDHLYSFSWAPCEVFFGPWCLKGLVPPFEQPLQDAFPVVYTLV